MVDRPRSAAASLYPHLKSGTRDVVERRDQPTSVAAALYPDLVPKPKPPNPYLERMTEDAWRDHLLALAGLRRKV